MAVIQDLEMEESISEFQLDIVRAVSLKLVCKVEDFVIGAADLET